MTVEMAAASRQKAEQWKAEANEEYKKNNYVEAIELYGRAIGMVKVVYMDNFLNIFVKLCAACVNDLNTILAVLHFGPLLELCPGEVAYLTNRAAAYLMINDYASAYQDATAALKMDPSNPKGR